MPNPRPFLRAMPHVSQLAGKFGDFFGSGKDFLNNVLRRLPPPEPGSTRLYRVDPNVPLKPSEEAEIFGPGVHPALEGVKGQWFTHDPDKLELYLASRGDPKLSYLDVPDDLVQSFRADLNPELGKFVRSRGEYIVPLDLLHYAKPVPLRPSPMPAMPPAARRSFLNE